MHSKEKIIKTSDKKCEAHRESNTKQDTKSLSVRLAVQLNNQHILF